MLGSTMRHHRLTKKHLYTQAALYAGASKELGPFIILSFYFIYICRYLLVFKINNCFFMISMPGCVEVWSPQRG